MLTNLYCPKDAIWREHKVTDVTFSKLTLLILHAIAVPGLWGLSLSMLDSARNPGSKFSIWALFSLISYRKMTSKFSELTRDGRPASKLLVPTFNEKKFNLARSIGWKQSE